MASGIILSHLVSIVVGIYPFLTTHINAGESKKGQDSEVGQWLILVGHLKFHLIGVWMLITEDLLQDDESM